MKSKYQRSSLILAIIFFTVGVAAAWGIVEVAYSSYVYVPISYSGDSVEIFGPKKPDIDWEYYERFQYKSWKPTINC